MDKTSGRVKSQNSQALLPVIGATSFVAFIGLALAYAAYMRRYVLHDVPLTAALHGDVRECASKQGRLGYYASRRYRTTGLVHTPDASVPLVFLHSINAAASSYEMKPLYEHYAQTRSVYALDLPGYGFSERGARPYSPRMYRDAINSFLSSELHDGPVDAVGLSLSCEFLALAALRRPEQFRSLTFISPTGFSTNTAKVRSRDGLLALLLKPQWRRLLFDTLTSRPSLKYFLAQSQLGGLDKRLEHYAYLSSHQIDAEYAPLYFIAGKLFTPTILQDYLALSLPVLAITGQSKTTRYEMLEQMRTRKNWRVVDFRHCGDLVHFDDAKGVIAQMDQHLRQK